MSTTTKVSAEEKAIKTAKLREFHKGILDAIDYDVVYRPKMFHKPKGKDTKHIIVFPSELKLQKDIYTEQIDHDGDSEDESRTLYKWPYDPDWANIYTPVTKEGEKSVSWYLIPVSDLVVVSIAKKDEIKETILELGDPDIDLPMDQMTIRDYYAIHHQVPVSLKKWLNALILKTTTKSK